MAQIYSSPVRPATEASAQRACFASADRVARSVSASMGVIAFTSTETNFSTNGLGAAEKSPS